MIARSVAFAALLLLPLDEAVSAVSGTADTGAFAGASSPLVPGCTVYTVAGDFEAACPDAASEDFEAGLIPTGGVKACPQPQTSAGDGGVCYDPDGLLPGISITATDVHTDDELTLVAAEFMEAASKFLLANYFDDFYQIEFEPAVSCVGFNPTTLLGGRVATITLTGAGGPLGTDRTGFGKSGTVPFWGVVCDDAVTQLEIADPANGSEGLDNLVFGEPAAPTGACCELSGGCTDAASSVDCDGTVGSYQGDGSDCDPDPCARPACDLAAIQPIDRLMAVKADTDVSLTWTADANANGYAAWYVMQKQDIPDADSAGAGLGVAIGVTGCINTPASACLHIGAVSGRGFTLLYYNLLGACDGTEAAD